MKAVLMTTPGGPEVLEVRDIPVPELKRDTELLIRLRAAGVNPLDAKLRARGTYYPDRLPCILGCDGAGEVVQIGNGVSRFSPGDAVYFCHGGIGGQAGTYAEYVIVDEKFVAHKPKSLSFTQAAAVPLVLITAWEALLDRARLSKGQQVLVHGGAGGVGHVAVQIAKLHGARVIATVSTPEKASLASQYGAERTVLYKRSNFVNEVMDWTKQHGVDIALDTVGGDTFVNTIPAVKVYGDLVTLLEPPTDCDWKTARLRNLRVSLELMLTPMYRGLVSAMQHQADILGRGADFLDAGLLKIHVEKTFPLIDAAAAHRSLMQASMTGKIVLTMD